MNTLVDYDDATHSFVVMNNQSAGEFVNIPYCLQDKDHKGVLFNEKSDNYGYKIFYKKNFVENDIFLVIEKDLKSRIGWLFPASSIISDSHDYATNPHYCRYAFIAHFLLIHYEISADDIVSRDFAEIINKDFVDNNAIFFIYDKSLTKIIPDFNVQNYYSSFYKYGYYLKNEEVNPEVLMPLANGKITISKISQYFIGDKFLDKFFNFLFFEKYPIIRFHILYQIIELLIEDILIFSLENTIHSFKNKKLYARSLRERISKIEKESDRILLLIKWCDIEFDYTILHDRCNTFITTKGRPSFDFPESLYAFRNFVVHDFRHMTDDVETVKDVNYQLELFVLDLLNTYLHKI
ncbi:MAG: hypothetical protein LBQ60_01220 [Bacteroidales bacterium]|jgi:hypothetical protein|nr:hypothetical protein [Bacteroidales bacterium]